MSVTWERVNNWMEEWKEDEDRLWEGGTGLLHTAYEFLFPGKVLTDDMDPGKALRDCFREWRRRRRDEQ